MHNIFEFKSTNARYEADAVALCCFDRRIGKVLGEFLHRQGIERPDMIVLAGGAKGLASPDNEAEREFILEQIRTSLRLHQTRRVVVTTHGDCGAYGGLARFSGNHEAEREFHESQLKSAVELVKERFSNASVDSYFVDFDGVWACER